ncbi:hypothetical protein BDA96_06G080500 [Sorghum bicolor]|uniref:Uncharacterized protein n=1 Tax=Sorghum bicolor TaxID=4558 RepID=A0A921UBM4_SORBI|nr:hypothetical protein BDA96_06G080500 [Sorghum bicolor]
MTPRCRQGEYFAERRRTTRALLRRDAGWLAGLRCPRRGCCLWPAMPRGLVSHAPLLVLRVANVARGALTPLKLPLPGRRGRALDAGAATTRGVAALLARVRPPSWRRRDRERWMPPCAVRVLAARRDKPSALGAPVSFLLA